jgi:tetratricopeptide (TPR) repeat protein
MKQITCEICGSNELVKQDGMFICQYCRTQYSLEEAKKMIEGTVKIDNSDKINNLYILAHRARDDNNYENAAKYYEMILQENPDSWEANFYTTYYQSINCKTCDISVAANRISACEDTVFRLIKENITDLDEQMKAVYEISERLIYIFHLFLKACNNWYIGLDIQRRQIYVYDYAKTCCDIAYICYYAGDFIEIFFGDVCGDIAMECWKKAVVLHQSVPVSLGTAENTIHECYEKILKYDPSYRIPTTAPTENKKETSTPKSDTLCSDFLFHFP